VNDHCRRRDGATVTDPPSSVSGVSTPASRTRSRTRPAQSPAPSDNTPLVVSAEDMQANIARLLGSHRVIRWAWRDPQGYLLTLSHVIMVVELVSLMTPMIAVGIQWITSLCDGTPPVTALLSVFYLMFKCVFEGDSECSALQNHCIVSPAGLFVPS
jgi:hypothetical protein